MAGNMGAALAAPTASAVVGRRGTYPVSGPGLSRRQCSWRRHAAARGVVQAIAEASNSQGASGSRPKQQPVLDELVLALMQRRAQQGQPPLQQAPPQEPAQQMQAVAQPHQPAAAASAGSAGEASEDVMAGLPSAAAQLVASVAEVSSSTPAAAMRPSPETALAQAAYEDAIAQRPPATVCFKLRLQAESGQRMRLVGSHEEMGRWEVTSAPELRCSHGDLWQVTLQLPAGCVVEYKYVLLDPSGHNVVAWQDGNNNVLAVRLSDESLQVEDNWRGDMRGKVVADGGTPETREGRLLAWAGDLFSQLSTQRADLRRSRLELAGAKEAEQDARDEAQFFRAQYKVKEAERAEAVAHLADAQALNIAMQAQLSQTTGALMEALDTADALLTQIDASKAEAQSEDEAEGELEPAQPRRRRRSAAAGATAASAATTAATPGAPAVAGSAGEEKPTPSRRRGRPRATAAAAVAASAAAEAGSAHLAAESPEGVANAGQEVPAPKTTRRRRATKTKVDASAAQ